MHIIAFTCLNLNPFRTTWTNFQSKFHDFPGQDLVLVLDLDLLVLDLDQDLTWTWTKTWVLDQGLNLKPIFSTP